MDIKLYLLRFVTKMYYHDASVLYIAITFQLNLDKVNVLHEFMNSFAC